MPSTGRLLRWNEGPRIAASGTERADLVVEGVLGDDQAAPGIDELILIGSITWRVAWCRLSEQHDPPTTRIGLMRFNPDRAPSRAPTEVRSTAGYAGSSRQAGTCP